MFSVRDAMRELAGKEDEIIGLRLEALSQDLGTSTGVLAYCRLSTGERLSPAVTILGSESGVGSEKRWPHISPNLSEGKGGD
jgi:hypothetical protein